MGCDANETQLEAASQGLGLIKAQSWVRMRVGFLGLGSGLRFGYLGRGLSVLGSGFRV